MHIYFVFFFKQKTAYEMRISDWSSDVCSSDLIVDLCFEDTVSRLQGARFADIEADQRQLAELAWSARKPIEQGGLYKFIHGGEYHMYNPDVIATLQKAVKSGEYADYQIYATHVNTRPVATIRDLFKLKDATPIPPAELDRKSGVQGKSVSGRVDLGG